MYNDFGEKKKLYKIINENSIPFKVPVLICIAFERLFISQIPNFLSSMSEIKYIIELNNPEFISFIYFAKNNIHRILWEEEEIINIKYDRKRLELPFLFYLVALIKDNIEIINYLYPINFIEETNKDMQNIAKKNQFKIIIKCKIIIDLIYNYRGSENYDEYKGDERLNEIENECKNYILNNIVALKNLNLFYSDDKIISMPIDQLYIDIIIALIKQKKFDDFDYTKNILDQMEIEKIFITETMFKKLCKLFNSTEDYIIDYSLTKKDDLFNEKNINFYYILLYYILKLSFYIYQINFLYEQKKFILKLYKSDELFNFKITKDKNYSKLEYILRMMLDSDFYFKDQLEKLKEILIYFKNFLFESKKEDIDIIENIIKNNKKEYFQYLYYYDTAIKMNIRKDIINYLFDLNNNNDESEIKKSVNKWNTIELQINEKKIEEIDKNIKELLINYFKDPNKQKELNKIFNQDAIKYFNNKVIPVEYKSTMMTTKAVANKKENNEENLDAGKPLREITKDGFIPFLLNKLEIFLHTSKKEKKGEKLHFIYGKIAFGENHIEINSSQFFNNKSISKEKQKNKQFNDEKERIKVNNMVKVYDFLEKFEDKIANEFIYNYDLILKLDFIKEKNNDNSDPEIENITCFYTFFDPINYEQTRFRESNILINGINSISQGSEYLIYEINNEIYKDIEYKEFNFKDEQSKLKVKQKDISDAIFSSINKIIENSFLDEITDEYTIIKFIKIIGNHPYSADFIIELKNGYYISGGYNKELILYDRQFIKMLTVDNFKDWVFSIFGEKESENIIEFNSCTYRDLTLINIDLQSLSSRAVKVFEIPNRTNIYCIEMKENNYIILGQGGAVYYIDLYNEEKVEQIKITQQTYSSGSKISDSIACLASNKLLIKGEDKLIFFNTELNEISDKNTIEGFSFNISINCLYLVKTESKLLLFCACKKYQENQENGILIVEIELKQKEQYKYKFHKTDFEVYCFCSISNIKNDNKENNDEINIDEKYRENIQKENTDYLFIAGFDNDKRQGTIKLYKIIPSSKSDETQIKNNDNSEETTIKYIQDITIDDENFEDFEGAISCMIQSSITGHILVTCENGNVYLFSQPNIEYFLRKDKEDNS